MSRFNIFNTDSPFHPFRWFVVFILCLSALTAWHDLTGRRFLSFSSDQWSAGGPGTHYHK